MNNVPVRVRIHSRQELEDGTAQTFASRANGSIYQKGDTMFLSYRETNGEDGSGMQTTWKLDPQQVILIRQGDSSLRAVFRLGETDRTTFVTSHGNLPLEVQVYRLENQMTLHGGILRVGYRMDIAGSVSRMDLEIQVKLPGV